MNLTRQQIDRFRQSPPAFRAGMMVDADDGAKPFVPDPWQAEDFAAVDRVWMRCVGLRKDGPRRAYIGRARGHSKSTDEALEIIWALTFAPKAVSGLAAAASRDQAQILRDRIQMLVMLNPWLAKVLDIQNYKIYNIAKGSPAYGSVLDIISSDAPSSYGAIVDFVLCDEFTHWKNDELWKSVMSTVGKRDHCALIIMTNAGSFDTWQREVFEKASQSAEWVFRNQEGPQASWISEDRLAEQRLMLPRKAYARLWLNQWQTEGGDALEQSDIENCIVSGTGPMDGTERGWEFVAGLDLSTKRHRSAIVVLGANSDERRVKLAYVQNWKPRIAADGTGTIDLIDVLGTIVKLKQQYGLRKVCYDPHQAALMAQAAGRSGVVMEEASMQGKGAHLIASTILQAFRSRSVELYNDAYLINDLSKLNIIEKRGNFKLEAAEDKTGHADSGLAFALCLPAAMDMATVPMVRPFTDRQMAMLPHEIEARLREIDEQENLQAQLDKAMLGESADVVLHKHLEETAPQASPEQEWMLSVLKECGIDATTLLRTEESAAYADMYERMMAG